jgi:hypothetical protein
MSEPPQGKEIEKDDSDQDGFDHLYPFHSGLAASLGTSLE